jgi:hypothetical protein
VSLRDAADYITSLPKAEQDLEEWQAAVEALLLVVELDGPTMMARIGMLRALNRQSTERALSRIRYFHVFGKECLSLARKVRMFCAVIFI